MLNQLGAEFCPGDSTPYQYVMDQAQCKAHAITVNGQNIFTAMEKAYFTTDDRLAIYETLTVAGLTTREILNYSDAKGVAGVYYNRYLDFLSKLPNDVSLSAGVAGYMGSDPSAEYARDTDHPPTNGKWWADIGNLGGKNVDPGSPYNTEAGTNHRGVPPGPIAAAIKDVIYAAAVPFGYPQNKEFYFISDKCGNIHYAPTYNQFTAINLPTSCPS